jgi:hypothetical protein
MNSTLSKFATFIIGAAVGSVATWWFTKEYYNRIADQEIEDMRKYYGVNYGVEKTSDEEDDEYIVREEDLPQEPAAEDIRQLAKITQDLGYTDYAKTPASTTDTGKSEPEPGRFEVISPEEYDTMEGFDTEELTYYADGVMTDEDDEIVDADEIVGMDPAGHFGEYEDDSVHIRDHRLKTDYEILRDPRAYSDVWSVNNPHEAED